MWQNIRTVALGSVILFVAPVWADDVEAPVVVNDPFQGEWVVQATPDRLSTGEGQAAFSEALLFHNGEFSAAAFAMFGFSPSTYVVSDETGTLQFTATLTSTDRGTLTWVGRQGDDGFVGTLVWDKQDGHVYRYLLAGARPGPT